MKGYVKCTVYLFLLLFLLIPALVSPPVQAKAAIGAIHSDEKGISLESIDEIFSVIKNEYVDSVTHNNVVNGALKGIREYLTKQKLDSRFITDIPAGLTSAAEIEKFNRFYRAALSKYPALNKELLSYAAIRGALKSLNDPYSVFLDPKEYASLMEQMKGGSFGGIGIYIELDKQNKNALTVVEAIEGTPASSAGLKSGDVVIKVDGKSTKNVTLNESQKLLRGEVGSKVTLTIVRPGVQKPFDVVLNRDTIRVKTLTSKMLEDNIGYIKLRIFGENTNQEIKAAMEDLESKGAKAYVLDLRNNGGGYVNAALGVCSQFLPTGSNVVTIVKKGIANVPYASNPNLRPRMPVVNLVNKFSASASEITAGALQDHRAGTIIGVKTFGKASVQKIFPLPSGSAMKVTTAHYVTPKGRNINKRGITPDILVEEKDSKTLPEAKPADLQLEAARNFLKEALKKQEMERVESSAFLDVVHVYSLQQQLEYIRKVYGDDAEIVKSVMVYQKGKLYDRVVIRKDDTKEEKTIIFDIQELL